MFQILPISHVAVTFPVMKDNTYECKLVEYTEQVNQQNELLAVSISNTLLMNSVINLVDFERAKKENQ